MKSFNFTINDPEGMHARPAGILAKKAAAYKSKVSLTGNGKTIDCSRIIAIMSLGLKKGAEVTISVEGEDEDTAAAELEAFFKENL